MCLCFCREWHYNNSSLLEKYGHTEYWCYLVGYIPLSVLVCSLYLLALFISFFWAIKKIENLARWVRCLEAFRLSLCFEFKFLRSVFCFSSFRNRCIKYPLRTGGDLIDWFPPQKFRPKGRKLYCFLISHKLPVLYIMSCDC